MYSLKCGIKYIKIIKFTKKYELFGRFLRNYSRISSRNGFDDYEKVKREFNFQVPEKFNFARDILDVWAQKEEDLSKSSKSLAFWFMYENGKEIKWNYRKLAENSKRAANILEKQCGMKKGDALMVFLPKIPEFWLFNIAAIRTGVILSPGSMQLRASDIKYRIQSLKPKCIIAEESIIDEVDKVTHEFPIIEQKILVTRNHIKKDGWSNFEDMYDKALSDHKCSSTLSNDPMMIFFTSGTTGYPKMVEHTQASYGIGLSFTGRYLLDLTEDSTIWNLSDTGWAKTAYSSIFAPWSLGACVFIHEMPRFDPSLVTEVLMKNNIDTFCASSTVYRKLLQQGLELNFPNLEHCVSGGEPVTAQLIQAWEKATGIRIYEGYGQTETVMLLGMFKCLDFKAGSIGKPQPDTNIVILDENGSELGPNEEGEIAVKRKPICPIGLFNGYKNSTEKNNDRFNDMYYRTGDLAYYDEDGYFWFVSRNDDIINSSGYRIGPYEVEKALLDHPSVADAAVVSSPDEERGEVVKAFVVLMNEYLQKDKIQLTEELQNHVKNITAPYKYPRKIEFVDELPRTVSGKVKRFELRNKEWKKK